MKIFIITHKKFKMVTKESIYVPLLVGADKNIGEKYYLKDNSIPDNISCLNKNFCELTGAYWIVRAIDEDIVGICHYRRYFCSFKKILKKHSILTEKKINHILNDYDIILPAKNNYEYNDKPAGVFFAENHDIQVWNNCKKIIAQKYVEYLKDFEWFENETNGYCYNMLITSKKIFDEYHNWLFNILFDLKEITDIEKYNDYNTRMFGFLSERLLNVWCHHHKLKIKEMPIYNSESSCVVKRVMRKLGEGWKK